MINVKDASLERRRRRRRGAQRAPMVSVNFISARRSAPRIRRNACEMLISYLNCVRVFHTSQFAVIALLLHQSEEIPF